MVSRQAQVSQSSCATNAYPIQNLRHVTVTQTALGFWLKQLNSVSVSHTNTYYLIFLSRDLNPELNPTEASFSYPGSRSVAPFETSTGADRDGSAAVGKSHCSGQSGRSGRSYMTLRCAAQH